MAKAFAKPKRLKMSKRSEKALDKSIEHWYRVRDRGERALRINCQLCVVYYGNYCKNCPIFLKTDYSYCRKTPYVEYNGWYKSVSSCKRKRLAQAEIKFLQSCYY